MTYVLSLHICDPNKSPLGIQLLHECHHWWAIGPRGHMHPGSTAFSEHPNFTSLHSLIGLAFYASFKHHISTFYHTLFGLKPRMRLQYPKCAYGKYRQFNPLF